MFSVIIPLYNKERHIEETIQTVLNQTYQEYEIIVVNDGSTDKGAEKVDGFNDKKIKLINQVNKGVSAARNRGAKEAKFDYLVFLDADDGLLSEYLFELKKLIEDFPDAALYSSNLYIHKKSTGEYIAQNKDFLPEKGIVDDYFQQLVRGKKILGCVTTVRKDSFFEIGGYQEGMIRAQDTHLFTRMMLKENLAFVNKILYYYTIGGDNQATENHHIFNPDYSLIDYLGVGNEFADNFILAYSIGHVKKMIRFGKKFEAKLLLRKILNETPAELLQNFNSQLEEVELLMKYPNVFFIAKRNSIRMLVKCKDTLKNLNLIKSSPTRIN